MPSEACQLFLDSMVMDFDKWHDGTGYDLEALGQLGPEERDSIEELLIRNLKDAGDWRDVQALVTLGTPSARMAVDKTRFHHNTKIRNYALRIILGNRHSEDMTERERTELEEQIVQAVKRGDFEMAESMPTVRVKKALLDSILSAEYNSEIRVSAVAFLLYLCGQAPEPFDWSQRPFFLLFSSLERNPKMLQQAWEHLRKRTGL
jgi:hypothetical protein